MVRTAWRKIKNSPSAILNENRTYKRPALRVLQAILSEHTTNRVGTNNGINIIRSNNLYERAIFKLYLHFCGVWISFYQFFGDVVQEPEPAFINTIPQNLASLAEVREEIVIDARLAHCLYD